MTRSLDIENFNLVSGTFLPRNDNFAKAQEIENFWAQKIKDFLVSRREKIPLGIKASLSYNTRLYVIRIF